VSKTGGLVTVRCTVHGEQRVRVYVKDTGAGLSDEQIGQLFQPFNRLGHEDSTEEGTGIGLVVTKQLVELMGGLISVESARGVGTEFWVEFPTSSSDSASIVDKNLGIGQRSSGSPG
jgi:signal transduction histidine kinase